LIRHLREIARHVASPRVRKVPGFDWDGERLELYTDFDDAAKAGVKFKTRARRAH
jgi:hypothetical protein